MQLAALLVRHLPADVPHAAAAVEARLAAALDEAHGRWPTVELDPENFLAWLAPRIPASLSSVEEALATLRLPDLYLACACAAGDPKALAAFDLTFLDSDSRTSDDVKQALRQKLFVGPAPRIALYAGRGDLGRWVRATALRMTIDEARATQEIPTEDALLDAIGIDPGHGPELAHLKKDARDTLQAAFREAVATLSDRDRGMLLQFYIDGVGVVELGKLYGLAPSNVSRTLARTRVVLLSGIRRSLLRHKQIHGDELDSLVDLVRSQLSLTGGLRRP